MMTAVVMPALMVAPIGTLSVHGGGVFSRHSSDKIALICFVLDFMLVRPHEVTEVPLVEVIFNSFYFCEF